MSHWTESFFRDRPELFANFFEDRIAGAEMEIHTLLEYLDEQGFQRRKVLDLNCGIGRHSIELGLHGIKVLGTDISPHYLEIARSNTEKKGLSDRVTFKEVDMREIGSTLASEKPFDGIVCLWTSFGFYDDTTNAKILRDCLKLVKEGGFFAIDIVNRDWLLQNYCEHGIRKNDYGYVLEERSFDPTTSRNHMTWTFLKQTGKNTFRLEGTASLDHRIWSLHELISLFESCGWHYTEVYPGFSMGFSSPKLTQSGADDVMEGPMFLVIAEK